MFEHEEIGSSTFVGASSEYLRSILMKIAKSLDTNQIQLLDMLRKSFFLSCDMAHAVHPNFPSEH
jgi:aspartyl aminopeptidase